MYLTFTDDLTESLRELGNSPYFHVLLSHVSLKGSHSQSQVRPWALYPNDLI